MKKPTNTRALEFLSTLSLRRATCQGQAGFAGYRNFYPRSPCGERLRNNRNLIVSQVFLSTLSLRRATLIGQVAIQSIHISIHALLAESDIPNSGTFRSTHISIHALLAESDHGTCIVFLSLLVFLSTLSLRRATAFFLVPWH